MTISQAVIGVPDVLGGGSGSPYASLLINTYGAAEVWRLTNMTSATIIASVNTVRNGTAIGWDLTAPNAVAGPVTGETGLAPYLDGVNDYGDLFTASFATLFNGSVGSIFAWAKHAGSASGFDEIFDVRSAGADRVAIYYFDTNLNWLFKGDGTSKTQVASNATTNWCSMGIAWNGTNVYFTLNGVQIGASQAQPAWTGGAATKFYVGAYDNTPTNPLNGNLAFIALRAGAAWTVADFLAMHNAASG